MSEYTYIVMESPYYYPRPGTGDWRYAGTSLRAAEAEFDVLVAKRRREAQKGYVSGATVRLVRLDADANQNWRKWETIREDEVGE